ncbi:MAG: PilZ domain-containing protein [Polyangiales bacterium]
MAFHAADRVMSTRPKERESQRPPPRKHSEVRPAATDEERRRAERWPADAKVEILSPFEREAQVVDVSATGVQVALSGWLSTGTLCDVRITAHTGREIYKRARVIWVRRVDDGCVAGLQVVASMTPPVDEPA